ncbi:hypothetical protein ADUPG1_007959 [Aduncisulcus paluster]|uniref:Phosphoserine phosphatase n=1 Tax=Aduncisulcus paluster TaxID=2918883 RepID=A0ABQ5KQ71_9EUKA|nr:hypothetical protein ADUPG1_007959 [Aduncisulcus paluster]|eukprot:gnl/Carplike_NY0171/2309_a3113_843.p1 GENE.gnl/Carplike_NY0171/2309_a3113_843~~gnl/Carplike_NY0171/2309_a3113_843.p1  ORF type:complete len:273 (-),score=36.36 gnl/Carplike_NY0171/2309_a3113_843:20-838(-)
MINKYKVAFFDVGNTLTIGTVWGKIHSSFDTVEHGLEHHQLFKAKKLTYKQWVEKDATFWVGKTRAEVISALQPIKLVDGASDALQFLQSQGVLIVLVSGGLLCNCIEVAKALDIDPFAIFSNELTYEDEKVTGAIGKCCTIHETDECKDVDAHEIELASSSPSPDLISSPPKKKLSFEELKKSFSIDRMLKGLGGISKGQFVHRFCSELGLSKEDVISVGDGENDIPLFKESKLSFAVNAKNPRVIEAAKFHGGYPELISILKSEFKKAVK